MGRPPAAARRARWSAPFFDTDALLTDGDRGGATAPAPSREPSVGLALAAGGRLRHDSGWYRIDRERLTPREVVEQLGRLCERFPVVAVEDGLADEDWVHWKALRERLAGRAKVVASELTGADTARIARAASERAAEIIRLEPGRSGHHQRRRRRRPAARQAGLALMVGAADAETEDDWLADLAVGLGAA